jgi:hypothetical protein
MSDCDNCLCHLKVCEAECCKEFKLALTHNQRVFKGMLLRWQETDPKMQDYYLLHNCGIRNGNIVEIKLKDFKKTGRELIIFERCAGLTADNLCRYHGTDKQPSICAYPNKTGTGGKVYLTPRCVFKNKGDEE